MNVASPIKRPTRALTKIDTQTLGQVLVNSLCEETTPCSLMIQLPLGDITFTPIYFARKHALFNDVWVPGIKSPPSFAQHGFHMTIKALNNVDVKKKLGLSLEKL